MRLGYCRDLKTRNSHGLGSLRHLVTVPGCEIAIRGVVEKVRVLHRPVMKFKQHGSSDSD